MPAKAQTRMRSCDVRILKQWAKLPAVLVDAAAKRWEALAPHVVERREGFFDADVPLHQAIAPENIAARLLPVLCLLTGPEIGALERAIVDAIMDDTIAHVGKGWSLHLDLKSRDSA